MYEPVREWREDLAAVRRGWWLVLLSAVLAGTLALTASLLAGPTERAATRLIVAPAADAEEDYALADSVRVLSQPGVIGTLAEIVENPGSLESAAITEGIPLSAANEYEVTAEEVAGALVLEVRVEGPDLATAQALASDIVVSSTGVFNGLYRVYEAQILDEVRGASDPLVTALAQVGVLGAVVGGGLAVLSLVGLERLRAPTGRRRGARHDDGVAQAPTAPKAALDDHALTVRRVTR